MLQRPSTCLLLQELRDIDVDLDTVFEAVRVFTCRPDKAKPGPCMHATLNAVVVICITS
jgi:hypothetical protein